MWESSEPDQNEDTSKEAEDGKEKPWGGTLEVRLLIAEEEAPVLIGKAGSNSKLLREKHGVHLTLGKTSNAPERICTIKGTVENLTECITHIAEFFVTNAYQIHKLRGGIPPGAPADSCTVAMLVHDTLAGLVIGRRGAVAKTIFTEIKGKVKVSDTCIPQTTDKVAYLTGTPEQLRQMLLLVLKYLVDKFPKADSPIRNYFPEPRSSYRYDENQWPKPPRKWGPPGRDPREYSPQRYDDRARSRDRYEEWGPGDRYSERPAYRPPFDDRYGPRDSYDRYGEGPPPRDPYYPSRPTRGGPPYGYLPDGGAAEYPPFRSPDYPPSRADYLPPRTSDFPPSRTSEYPPARPAAGPSARASDYPPSHASEYPPSRAPEYPSSRAAEYPPSRAALPSRAAEYPPPRAAEYPPSRAAEYPPSRAAEYPPSRAAEHPPLRASEYPSSRAVEHPHPRTSEYPLSRTAEYPPATSSRGAPANGYENYPARGPVGGLLNGGSSYGAERSGTPFAAATSIDGERRAPLKASFNAPAAVGTRPTGAEPWSSYGATRPVW